MNQAENANIAIHGQIGKEIIYWVSKGIQYKRIYKIPDDPKTFDQRTQRNKFYLATQTWNELTTEQKKDWDNKVKKTQYVMTGYNFFIQKKIKEITQMIKKVTHGSQLVSNGSNVITINEIQLDKTVLLYNCFVFGEATPTPKYYGIRSAYFSDSTHITVSVMDSENIGDITIFYTIIEYV